MTRIQDASVAAYTVPTDAPESDGTLQWRSTTLVVVRLEAGARRGLGYTYADKATATLIDETLLPLLEGKDALDIPGRWREMVAAIRNLGRPGIASMAIAAVDVGLWDLKAKILQKSLSDLLGRTRKEVPLYGSGGFTSYSPERLREQLGAWAAEGFRFVKMKVGREPSKDVQRVRTAKEAVGNETQLFVDANGAYTRKQALSLALEFSRSNVAWFEEPVSSDDLEGLRLIRDRGPAGMAIAAGEYGYDLPYFRRMLAAGAVDVLQADATRCAGVTGFMAAASLAQAFGVPLSSHCAPTLHLPLMCAVQNAAHLEYFHDHVRIEQMLFDGAAKPSNGLLSPDASRPGLGIELKERDAGRYAA